MNFNFFWPPTASGGSPTMGANQSLSNLTSPTAINQELIFGTGIDGYISTKFEPAGTSNEMNLRTGDALTTGDVRVRSGDGDATGGVFISSGSAAVNSSGDINLLTGSAPSGDSGNINLTTSAGPSRGAIFFNAESTNILDEKELRFYDAGSAAYIGLKSPAVGASHTLTLPAPSGITGALLSNDGFGNTSWVQLGGVGGAGTVLTNDGSGNLSWATPSPVFAMVNNQFITGEDSGAVARNLIGVSGTDVTTIGNTVLGTKFDGQYLQFVSQASMSFQTDSLLNILGNGTAPPQLFIYDNTFAQGVGITVPNSVPTGYVITLPAAQGAAGQTLENDGSGVLSWVTPGAPAAKYLGIFSKDDGQQLTGNGVSVTAIYNLETTDSENWYDNTTGILTATRSCNLRVSVGLGQLGTNIVATGRYKVQIFKNSSSLLYTLGDKTATYNGEPFAISGGYVIIPMANNDTLEVKCFLGPNHSVNPVFTETDPQYNFWMVEEL